mgnify:CR=1 FL=1
MGAYNSAIITTSGQTLIANAISGGGTVTFSSMQASSYSYPEGTNIADLTSLQDVQQTVQPFSAQVFNDTMIQVSARFDNSEVSEAYLVQTIGIFAQLGEESPVLLAVVQATTPDQMPAQSAVSPSAFIYNIQITVQQATSISVSVNPSGTATVQDILDLQQQINAKVQAIGGNVSDTVSDAEEPEDAIKYPDIPSTGGTAKTLFGYLVRWVKSLKADKVDSSGGDINGTKVSKFTSSSDPYPVPVAGDSLSTIMGKVVKFFSDIRSAAIGACYIGQLVSNNTTDNPNLPASAAAVYQEAQLRAQQIAQLNSDIWSLGWQNEVSDCDAATQNNTVYAAKGTALHRPLTNDTFFTVWAYAWDANNITQFASTYGPNLNLYARKRSLPGVWGGWEHIYPPK